eukprot:7604807-Pyramimonas_sp.AAC.1
MKTTLKPTPDTVRVRCGGQGGPGTGRYGKQRARHVRQIPFVDANRQPFMFVTWVNMGPFILRR